MNRLTNSNTARSQHYFLLLIIILLNVPMLICAQKKERPNILWITSEDNSADWLSCYGNLYAETPNIDKLANEGFLYTNAYANAPVCAGQRSTWITGVMSLSMGTHNMRSLYKIPHDEIKYYPDLLNEEGYYTGNFKKTDYNIGGRNQTECWDNPEVENWDELKNNQPFFQVINLGESHESRAQGDVENTIHSPDNLDLREFHPDVPDVRKNYAKYYDAIKRMDADVGLRLKKLKEMGLAENTIVVYNSDHGGVLPRSKRFLFANSLHCPLVIRIPEAYKALWPADKPDTKIDRMVSFVDMPKTWLSLAGAKTPSYMQGSVFLGGETEKEQQYHFAFRGRMDERLDNARSLNDKRYLYIRNYMPYVPWMQRLEYLWKMKATTAWKKEVEEGRANELQSRFFKPKQWTEELYDMQEDADCTVNLIGQKKYKKKAAELRSQLRKKQIEIFDAGLLPETEMERLAKKHNTTVYELVRNSKLYDVKAIIDAADLALEQNPENLHKLRGMLKNNHVGIRYWGLIGCFLLNDREAGLQGVNDESDEIRAMAAYLLVRIGEKEKGLLELKKMIEKSSYALLTVFNIIDWMGDDGKELLTVISSVEIENRERMAYGYQMRMKKYLTEDLGF
jgi:N-sulfoglucosamine sulfohydrolase